MWYLRSWIVYSVLPENVSKNEKSNKKLLKYSVLILFFADVFRYSKNLVTDFAIDPHT